MRVSVTGSSGLIGSALVPFLTAEGHDVGRVVRSATAAGAWRWEPDAGRVDAAAVNGADAVVHLAGESIAAGRWSAARKARIRDSRVRGTRVVAEAVARSDPAPGSPLRFGDGLLRRPRRRASDRGERARPGLPVGGLARVGGGVRPRARFGRPRREPPLRDRAEPGRGSWVALDDAVGAITTRS